MTELNIGLLNSTHDAAGKDNAADYWQQTLEKDGHQVRQIVWGPALIGDLSDLDIDFMLGVSTLAEAALLKEMAIPYAGSDPITIATAMDNSLSKKLWQRMGLPTLPFLVAEAEQDCQIFAKDPPFDLPLSVRPVVSHKSAGMDSAVVVEDHDQLVSEVCKLFAELDRPVLIEQFAPGREIVLGILGNGDTVTLFPPLEIVRPADNKDGTDVEDLACPASLSDEQIEMLHLLARRAYAIQRFQDGARLDVVLTAEGPMLLRANPLVQLPAEIEDPGSYLGLMAQAADTNVVSELAHITAQRLGLEPAQATKDD